MKSRILITFALSAISGYSLADWKYVGTSGDNQTEIYADPLSIKNIGNNRRQMSTIFDFKTAKTQGSTSYKSIKSRFEFDCNNRQLKAINTMAYSGNMEGGSLVANESPNEDWRGFPQGSPYYYLFAIACDQKN